MNNWYDNLEEIPSDEIPLDTLLAFKMHSGYVIVDKVGAISNETFYNSKGQKIGHADSIHKFFLFEPESSNEVIDTRTLVAVAQLSIDLGREDDAEEILDLILDSAGL